ncbi:MAG TPA: hypothetical protein VGH28_09235 [Polyangiaceae bacterium]|jgi:hypothetical protein
MTMSRAMLALPLVLACASAPPPPVVATHRAPTTRFRVGDFVVYRYSGLFTPEPVELRERIAAQDGLRLTIDVTATRGSEQRHWEQVVTDTPENERNGVVDELYEYVGGKRRKLANVGNADLVRLYSWTILQPDGKAHDVRTEKAMLTVGRDNYTCDRKFGKNEWHGKKLQFERFDCPEFLWTHARARFWDDATGEEILRADVSESGNQP